MITEVGPETVATIKQVQAPPPQDAVSRVCRVLLWSILMVAPLAFGAVQPWAWGALSIASTAVLGAWIVSRITGNRVALVLSALHAVVALALALVAGQFLTGKTLDPIGTRESLIKLVGYGAVLVVSGQLSAEFTAGDWRQLGLGTIAYVFAMSVFAMAQFFANPELIYWSVRPRWGGAIFGPYVNHNHYAGLMEVLLPVAIGAVVALPSRHALKALGIFAALLGFASLLLCGSRGGTIAVLVELALFVIVALVRRGSGQRVSRIAAPLALAVIGLSLFLWLDPGMVQKRWQTTVKGPELAATDRFTMTRDSLRMLHDFPIFGAGAGAFEVAYPAYQSWVAEGTVDHAHNDYAEALAETGVAGGVMMLAAIALFFYEAVRGLGARSASPGEWVRIGAAVGVCGLLIHSFIDFNLHIPANAAWFSAAAGIVAVGGAKRVSGSAL